jgi:hypothetical protein
MKPTLRHRNGVLYVENTPLQTEAAQFTYLSEDAEIGESVIFFQNVTGFSDNDIVLIQDFGSESAEIVVLDGTPDSNGVTLATALERSHPVGSRITVLSFNQIELSHATTAAGVKSVLATVDIEPDDAIQKYPENSQTSGFYFARYYNTETTTFGSYTDALSYGGWDENTVGHMVERSLRDVDERLSEKITKADCYAWINDCLDEIKGKQLRWAEHYVYDFVAGQVLRGSHTVSMPADIYDRKSNKAIIAFRIGDSDNLTYLDPLEFEEKMGVAVKTQVRTEAAIGQTTLEIDNSYDFADSGTVHVYVSGTRYALTYTGITRSASAGVLTGIPASGDGAITAILPVDSWVWQAAVEGTPRYFTVRNGAIEFYNIANATWGNKNAYLDYNTAATAVSSDGDIIDFHRYKMVQEYLKWRIKMKARNNGTLDMNDGFYIQYRSTLNDAIRNSPRNLRFKESPKLNTMSK